MSADCQYMKIDQAAPGTVLADTDGDHWIRHNTGAVCVDPIGRLLEWDDLLEAEKDCGPFRVVETPAGAVIS